MKKVRKNQKQGMVHMERKRKLCGKYLIVGAVSLAAFGGLLLLAARKITGFAEWYGAVIYPVLVQTAGRFWGIFPFSVVEIGMYAGGTVLLCLLVRNFKNPGKVLPVYGFVLGALLFLYGAGCGVNYYRKPFSASLDFGGQSVEREDLKELCLWLTEQVNLAREELGRAKDAYENLPEKGVAAMEKLSGEYPSLSGYYPKPKPVLVSRILSIQQYSGVYSPFTVEANYNRDMVSYNIPHTICHELSHLDGFMREDEANFIGYLACLGSDDADFRYSGFLLGWIYAGNALAEENFEEYGKLYGMLSEEVREDLDANREFWAKYEGKAAKAAERVNDAYLKANGQGEGILTYGRVVDLMILDFVKNHRE